MNSSLATRLILSVLARAQAPKPADHVEFFGLDRIWDVHLTMTQEAWVSMFPEGGTRFGFAQQRPKFPYARARLKIGTHRPLEVGIRFKRRPQPLPRDPERNPQVHWLPWDLNLALSASQGFGQRHVLHRQGSRPAS